MPLLMGDKTFDLTIRIELMDTWRPLFAAAKFFWMTSRYDAQSASVI
jgi:hypothetical protein